MGCRLVGKGWLRAYEASNGCSVGREVLHDIGAAARIPGVTGSPRDGTSQGKLRLSATTWSPHEALGQREGLPAGAARVLRRIEEDADLASGVRQVREPASGDVAVPEVACVSPTMIRMVVDLPAPLGPKNPVTRLGEAVKLTSSTARLEP